MNSDPDSPPDTPTMMTEEQKEMVRAAIRRARERGARMVLSEEEVSMPKRIQPEQGHGDRLSG